MVLPGTLFEEMGFNYIGPMDGHDVKALVRTLRNIRKLRGPQFLHVVTRKGKGYAPAEADPIKWHGPGPFDPASGTIFKEKSTGPSYSQIFGQWLCDMAARRPTHHRHHPGHARGLGTGGVLQAFPGALLRCRHRRATRGDFCGGARDAGAQARGRHLLDLPAARLRPADPRCGAAESAGRVRGGSRRTRRQRRRDPPGELRPVVRALHPQHGDHGAGGRERVPADVIYRPPRSRARPSCAIRAAAVRARRW